MNKKYTVLLLFISIILSGCSSYRDINLTTFITMTVIDVNEEGEPIVYMECFTASYSQINNGERGQRVVLIGKGKTISECIQKINQTARQQVSTVYSKMIVFTKKAAEKGLEDYTDVLVRHQEYLLRPYIVIFDGDPMTLMNVNIKQGDFVGLYLEELFQSDPISNTMHPFKLAEYINLRASKSQIAVMSIVGVMENEADPYVGIKEGALLEKGKMVGTLTEDEYKTYCLMDGMTKATLITVPHPEDKESYVTFNAVSRKVKKSIEYDGESGHAINYEIQVKLVLVFKETQKPINLQDEKIRKLMDEEVKQKLKVEGEELFEKYKIKGIDLLSVEDKLYRKYPQYKVIDVVGSTVFEVKVVTHFGGSPDVQNYTD